MQPSDQFPDFFDAAPRIALRDPLAAFLGAASGGAIEYGYADVVKLAGHSCPTVASAYLMTRATLGALYGGVPAERGAIRVALRDPATEGVTGVIANVVGMLTGATFDTGFKGIGGRFDRRRLLAFGEPMPGQLRFTRVDTEASVGVSARLDRVPGDPRIADLLPRCLAMTASPDEATLFRELWQARVRRLLLDHADDADVIVLHR
ncbi:hypothetical protein [Burkholderia thailandensis]|uniref:Formylmethanofuran dehydrogenase subunit E domain-containing protein n=1 Tax=Burkholderia thailandensis TaxID=57975 RepID=A0AAW9CKI7_BURTH|nr:hypothetical protein [Burkholderia thailandensis]AIP67015.1 hypothetical protein DR62_3697 [Burkholderia thailandensis]AOI54766.1 hypothetical protein WI24_23450 [Burkholderia thailandensis]MCS3392499.1 hypothetical protein [Burkholderia thailandensis]MCS6425415.1 hypothetical protein [Burkholderia thailandensis]MCS6453786.1 hypothetical protein [Burkholderia thailandensis]